MKKLNLGELHLYAMSEKEMVKVSGGGPAGPPASYWTSDYTPAQMNAYCDMNREGLKFIMDWYPIILRCII